MTTENTENTTSQVSHAGDSTTQHTKHDTGVGSSVWLGRFILLGGNGLRTSICENQQRIQSSLEYRRQLLGSIASNWVTMRLLLQSVFVTGVIYRTELRGRLMLCLSRLVMVLLSKRVSCFCSWVSSFFRRTSQVSNAGDSTQNNSSDSKPALALVAGPAPDFDAIGKWHQDRYAVFTNRKPVSGGPFPNDEFISSLLRLQEWERTHPLEERTPRTMYSQEEWNAHTLSTQQALASLCDREYEHHTAG